MEKQKHQLTTMPELHSGDVIRHHVWGPLKFKRRSGSVHFFQSEEYGTLDFVAVHPLINYPLIQPAA